jgi:dolichol-phosphate mannosyltransferase
MRLLNSGLFLSGLGLYKARAARGQALEHDGIERNIGMALALSVVVPVRDEEENVGPLAHEIAFAIAGQGDAEIIFVDDGSADATASVLKDLKSEIPALRVIQHGRNIGQSRAIRTGVRAARSEIIVTLDGDGQNDPADIPKLLAVLRGPGAEGIGLVSGVRMHRQDSAKKKLASGLANRFRRMMLQDGAHDTGCGLKVFRREVFLALPYFDNLHRFLIALILREGYEVRFVEVGHRPRLHGRSKYGVWDRLAAGISDIFGVRWLKKRFKGAVAAKEI